MPQYARELNIFLSTASSSLFLQRAPTTNCNCSSFCILIFTALTSHNNNRVVAAAAAAAVVPAAVVVVVGTSYSCCRATVVAACGSHLSAAADNCNNALSNDNCYNFYR